MRIGLLYLWIIPISLGLFIFGRLVHPFVSLASAPFVILSPLFYDMFKLSEKKRNASKEVGQ